MPEQARSSDVPDGICRSTIACLSKDGYSGIHAQCCQAGALPASSLWVQQVITDTKDRLCAGLGFAGAAAAYSVSNIMECILLLAIVLFGQVPGLPTCCHLCPFLLVLNSRCNGLAWGGSVSVLMALYCMMTLCSMLQLLCS